MSKLPGVLLLIAALLMVGGIGFKAGVCYADSDKWNPINPNPVTVKTKGEAIAILEHAAYSHHITSTTRKRSR